MANDTDQLQTQMNSLKELFKNSECKILNEMLSDISHDFKTPITVILGAIQLMESQAPENERRKSLKHFITIKQNCYRLLRLVNNILDINKVESGHFKLNLTNCNIVYLVEEIASSILPFTRQKSVNMLFDTQIEEIITAVDIDKIERTILNLLSNAIKFTGSGGNIYINMYAANNNVIISIKDDGAGIPPEKQKLIFERFKQSSSSLTKHNEGTGIGLCLVKYFIEMHEGKIDLKSKIGEGSEFIIKLPIRTCRINNSQKHSNSDRRIQEAINIEFSDIYSFININERTN